MTAERGWENSIEFGAVVIGRNEGERLKRCLRSISDATIIVYVDLGSTDGSVQLAHDLGVEVVNLDASIPFTAARARNKGFQWLREAAPQLTCVNLWMGIVNLFMIGLMRHYRFLRSIKTSVSYSGGDANAILSKRSIIGCVITNGMYQLVKQRRAAEMR